VVSRRQIQSYESESVESKRETTSAKSLFATQPLFDATPSFQIKMALSRFYSNLWNDPWEGDLAVPTRLFDQYFGNVVPEDFFRMGRRGYPMAAFPAQQSGKSEVRIRKVILSCAGVMVMLTFVKLYCIISGHQNLDSRL